VFLSCPKNLSLTPLPPSFLLRLRETPPSSHVHLRHFHLLCEKGSLGPLIGPDYGPKSPPYTLIYCRPSPLLSHLLRSTLRYIYLPPIVVVRASPVFLQGTFSLAWEVSFLSLSFCLLRIPFRIGGVRSDFQRVPFLPLLAAPLFPLFEWPPRFRRCSLVFSVNSPSGTVLAFDNLRTQPFLRPATKLGPHVQAVVTLALLFVPLQLSFFLIWKHVFD